MKKPQPNIAKNLDTGEEINLDDKIPPHVYTSVHQWRPIAPDRFVQMLHAYQCEDRALDEFNHGKMTSKGLNLDATAEAQIFYIPKEVGSPVSSPVLMTMRDGETGKVTCFASTRYGVMAGNSQLD